MASVPPRRGPCCPAQAGNPGRLIDLLGGKVTRRKTSAPDSTAVLLCMDYKLVGDAWRTCFSLSCPCREMDLRRCTWQQCNPKGAESPLERQSRTEHKLQSNPGCDARGEGWCSRMVMLLVHGERGQSSQRKEPWDNCTSPVRKQSPKGPVVTCLHRSFHRPALHLPHLRLWCPDLISSTCSITHVLLYCPIPSCRWSFLQHQAWSTSRDFSNTSAQTHTRPLFESQNLRAGISPRLSVTSSALLSHPRLCQQPVTARIAWQDGG